jgi:hypothetical protein
MKRNPNIRSNQEDLTKTDVRDVFNELGINTDKEIVINGVSKSFSSSGHYMLNVQIYIGNDEINLKRLTTDMGLIDDWNEDRCDRMNYENPIFYAFDYVLSERENVIDLIELI